jgi:glycosyltransferase involved in cell wall biosynthesis
MRLSVITVNYNNAEGLQKTISSVLSQTWKDFEYIIIDGASTDESLEIIKKYSSQRLAGFPAEQFKWISEPDTGIYNAMNKGIRMSKGEYLHFLNSGDWLVNDKVYERLNPLTSWKADVIYGNKIEVYADGREILNKGISKSNLTFDDAYRGVIPHTATFTKKKLFKRFGLFDETFRIVSDTAFYLKAIGLGQGSSEYIDCTISYFDMQGISKNPSNIALRKKELKESRNKILSPWLVEIYEFYLKEGYKLERLQRNRLTRFLFRVLNKMGYIMEK